MSETVTEEITRATLQRRRPRQPVRVRHDRLQQAASPIEAHLLFLAWRVLHSSERACRLRGSAAGRYGVMPATERYEAADGGCGPVKWTG